MLKFSRSVTIFFLNNARIDNIYERRHSKQANIFNKLFNKGKKKRFEWRNFDAPTGPTFLPQPGSISRGPQAKKRVAVLNKLFMKQITDLMATGNLSAEIAGHGIEVTKVKVGSEFNIVNVYWVCNGELNESEVSFLLNRAASELRHELSNLRVIGNVPKVQFVRDRIVSSWTAVEAILSRTDMGADYEPRGVSSVKEDFGNEKRTAFQPAYSFQPEIIKGDDYPSMRHNVFGIDRTAIMERIIANKSGLLRHKMLAKEVDCSLRSAPMQPFSQGAFNEFLLNQKIAQKKALKPDVSDVELCYEPAELQEDEINDNIYEDEDYLDDDVRK